MNAQRNIALIVYPYAGYDRALLRGIATYGRHHGPWVFHLSGDWPGLPLPEAEAISVTGSREGHAGPRGSQRSIRNLAEWGVDGVIGRLQSKRLVDQLVETGLPVIAMDKSAEQCEPGHPLADVPDLRPDSYRLGQMAAEHFIERGFQRFAFCGYAGRRWSDERCRGLTDRLDEACFACEIYEPPRAVSRHTWDKERPVLRDWVESLSQPVAVLAANDIRGRQMIEVAHLLDRAVPEEVAVLGVDNDVMLCELGDPPLSSIALSAERAGYAAAERLDRMMQAAAEGTPSSSARAGRRRREPSPEAEILVEPVEVITRQSTDVVAADDAAVAGALRFIRENARFPIGVEDVVERSGLSRRTLQVRFQKTLGRPVREEIQRARLALARQLLLETDLPVWQVAEGAGFNSLSYLERVFRRETGMSLGRFRRRHRHGAADATAD
jgi:LacI family transcriptional regulator